MPVTLKAPQDTANSNVNGTIYQPDDDGHITVHAVEHEETLRKLGYTTPGEIIPQRMVLTDPTQIPEPTKQAEVVKPTEPRLPDAAPNVSSIFKWLNSMGLIEGQDYVREIPAVTLLTLIDGVMERSPPGPPLGHTLEKGTAVEVRQEPLTYDPPKELEVKNEDGPPTKVVDKRIDGGESLQDILAKDYSDKKEWAKANGVDLPPGNPPKAKLDELITARFSGA